MRGCDCPRAPESGSLDSWAPVRTISRQPDHEPRAAARSIFDPHRSPVTLDQLAHHGKPDTSAWNGYVAARHEAHESVPDPGPVRGGDARPFVLDGEVQTV